jgi:sterol O-acyltransferase
MFPSIDYSSRVSHFDRNSDYRDFQGFYHLFWVALFFMVTTAMTRNIKDTGYPFRVRVWQFLSTKVWQLAVADGTMVLSSGVVLPLHRLFRTDALRWYPKGIIIQSLFQTIWFTFWVA